MAESRPIQFVVCATGPCGVFWLSKPSNFGLRTIVARDQAELFPTVEAAKRAIKRMPKGYRLARVAFAIEPAARHMGWRALAIEIEERWSDVRARRLDQNLEQNAVPLFREEPRETQREVVP